MPLPTIAIVGRPNVGKSSLFNRLLGKRIAIVDETPGLTRDRLYGVCEWAGRRFQIVDTGGLTFAAEEPLLVQVRRQVEKAIEEADLILFVVDAKTGISPEDTEIAQLLRESNRPVLLVANKVDNPAATSSVYDFFSLGLGDPIPISALHGIGIDGLLEEAIALLPKHTEEVPQEGISVAIVGRPNVGKSSLVNAILQEERVIVDESPGTTRDAVDTALRLDGQRLVLIDTAGLKRKARITHDLERYSMLRTLRAIERAEISALLLDASVGVTSQDRHIVGEILSRGKALIIVVNKWDLVSRSPKGTEAAISQVRQELRGADFAPVLFVSAKKGWGLSEFFWTIFRVAQAYETRIGTGPLNRVIEEAQCSYAPPATSGRGVRIYYATQPETRPPTIVLFVNNPDWMPEQYLRYLEHRLRQAFPLEGTPIRFKLRARRPR
ncbi:MAG: ribosome biogenesis GTPase Der [Armatimonadota bacterium]|nr:ribosome biogenesis GTPase Der [Armatimonadota bacterium]